MVPTMFSRLLRLPAEVRERADLSSLEAIVHAAAPCPVPVKEQMIEWFGPIIIEYYGATEANGFTLCDSEEWLAHRGTVGRPVLGELHILDDDGAECPVGTPGTVWFKGATNFEYFNAPEKTQESRDSSGAMSTVGDVGYVDADGLPLSDRPQDLHDHLGGSEHLSPGDREPPDHPPQGLRRGGDRRAQRGSRGGGQGDRAADARRGSAVPRSSAS